MNPPDLVKLTIDGREIETRPGQTLLAVAKSHGIDIPTLCHDPRLPARGSCQLCVVEVDGAPRLQLSCATEARTGMRVQTRSERVVKARRSVLELLLSNHFADCQGPCSSRCPAGVDVQGYLALAAAGQFADALHLILKANPFPSVCGRVCVRYCELACARREVDQPVAINFVKRYITELVGGQLAPPPKVVETGPAVAIVGGGPAGLTAAYLLRLCGLGVTVFEAQPELGGMLRYGIPDYRLPRELLDREIDYLIGHNITVKTSSRLGRDLTLDTLRAQGFAAILLALGAQRAKPLGVANESTPGVVGGVDFLEGVKKRGPQPLRGPVLVVGGGNTAIDAARTALRCGASRVTILYRRTREEMPADPHEIDDALAEGVVIEYLVAPQAVVAESGRVKALHCQEMRLGEPDQSGRRRPVPVEGKGKDFLANLIIAAIGQDVDLSGTTGSTRGDVATSKWSTLAADPRTMATNVPGVFAAGDVVSGPAAVVDAIAQGRRAAEAIASFVLTGEPAAVPISFLSRRQALGEATPASDLVSLPRAAMPKLAPEERVRSFAEVELGIDRAQVATEVDRCLACGCSAFHTCELRKYGDEYQVSQETFRGRFKRYKVDHRHPLIALDPNKCILCGRCVRLCGDLLQTSALGFLYRGFDTLVRPTMERSLHEAGCISCGNCIDTCPTGAISYGRSSELTGTLTTTPHPSVCNYCGVGCNIVFNKHDEELWYASAQPTATGANGDLCVRGRFGHRLGRDPERLMAPLVREGAGMVAATAAVALERALAGLKRVAERHGPAALGFFVSPRATNEEIYLVQKLARDSFGTNNIGSFFHLTRRPDDAGVHESVGLATSTLPIQAIEEADVIMAINTEISEANPVLGFHVQRALKRHARLTCVSATPTRLSELASERLAVRRGTTTQLLRAVARALLDSGRTDAAFVRDRTEGIETLVNSLHDDPAEIALSTGVSGDAIEALAALLGDPTKNVVVIYDDDDEREKAPDDLQAIINLLLLTGRFGKPANGLILARHHANGQGMVDLGGLPEGKPDGGAKLAGARSTADLAALLEEGRLKGLLIVGEDPAADPRLGRLIEAAEMVVAMDLTATETTWRAHVVLPGTIFAETAGSATNMERRVQTFAPVFAPPAGLSGFELLSQLHGLAVGRAALSLVEVRAAIAAERPGYAILAGLTAGQSFFAHAAQADGLLFAQRFLTPSGRARFRVPTSTPRTYPPPPRSLSTLDVIFESQVRRTLSPGRTASAAGPEAVPRSMHRERRVGRAIS